VPNSLGSSIQIPIRLSRSRGSSARSALWVQILRSSVWAHSFVARATARVPAGVPAGDTQALPPSLRGMLYPSGIGRALSPRRGLIACCRNPRESRDSEALTLSFGRSVLRCFAGPSSGILLAVAWPSQVLALPGGMTPPLTRDSSSERSRLSVCLLDPYKDTAAAISGVYEK